jgi:hypothetical protein
VSKWCRWPQGPLIRVSIDGISISGRFRLQWPEMSLFYLKVALAASGSSHEDV